MKKSQSSKVFVGLSGGVDSSVTAALLQQQGYEVTGVYMKNWSKDLPGFPCPWKEDYQDAKRVAVKLGIPFELFDFENEYFDRVVQYMLDGFKAGITPNPDIMCNQEIKFKLFYDVARSKGADFIATGHYAKTNRGQLLQATDTNKDQTYFLYRVQEDALKHTLFPLGELTKPEVRKLALKFRLVTATKKESMGICFVGKVGIKEFLSQYVQTEPGDIIDQNGAKIGTHDGAIFYTIGQRHGLDVGGGLPYYVTGKNMQKNEVYVTSDLNDAHLWSEEIKLDACHWISAVPKIGETYYVRTRHRAKLIACTLRELDGVRAVFELSEPIRALTPGQSAVFYRDEICLGGGIIC
ncbi:MAG TPA: tRNA 2-thiouridine(34) synthase MnmA [Candidatus Saccharibacteria bacterium]|jgi:tRNA-specific 2-thiouridylase|nr:tRNA 2-thiouridine(34) synthase MnmA [Candidatus Saccharibacteria bacterium]HMT55665.1 tRNA 2-thiouridine(34) synthase MnmA [Candidatus Saccharibacteria bacterium]